MRPVEGYSNRRDWRGVTMSESQPFLHSWKLLGLNVERAKAPGSLFVQTRPSSVLSGPLF